MAIPEYVPDHPAPAGEERGVPWDRYLAALLRYKWLILALAILGGAGGVGASRFVRPRYEAQATLWISEGGDAQHASPIRAQEILSGRSWAELLRSFEVLEKVVHQRSLFLTPLPPVDSTLFRGFAIDDSVHPGTYTLELRGSDRYALVALQGAVVDSGVLGDSIGRPLGFRWAPPAEAVRRAAPARFSVSTPRTAAIALRTALGHNYNPEANNLLRITLQGPDPAEVARTLNAVAEEFVATAADLKKRSLVENSNALREQLQFAFAELQAAEIAFENFRVSTITLPSEGTAVAAGVEITRDPVFAEFFEQRVESDRARRDREALERIIAAAVDSGGSLNALAAIPSVQTQGTALLAALTEFQGKEANLRSLRAIYTDQHPEVIEAQRVMNAMRTEVVIPLARAFASQLRDVEQELESRLASTSRELRQIPTRTIEELRLRRNVQTRENLYTMLRNRYEEARLAEASSVPDVSILDHAVRPQLPTGNSKIQIILLGFVLGFGLGGGGALLLDRFDPRFRYPEQATRELGLPILGAVPGFDRAKARPVDLETAAQVVEAFRSIRLSVFHAAGGRRPLQVTVSSPGIGDGKSLVSSNLALSFAEAGYSTLLIDGDVRRGGLHAMFGVPRRGGLVDYLEQAVELADVLKPTGHDRLTLLPSGRRSRHAPELIASARLEELFVTLRSRFEVIVVDSPPLGAGIDPFALGAVTENMLIVLRSGETDRHMASAKLEMLDRLPVRVLGAVLNDIRATGSYRYYTYLYGYAQDEEPLQLAGS